MVQINPSLLYEIGALLGMAIALIGAYFKIKYDVKALETRVQLQEVENQKILTKLDEISSSISNIEKAMAKHGVE